MRTVKVIAPAKVNLFLGIGSKRPDGYHDAITAMHALAMHDILTLTLVEAGEVVSLMEPGDAAQPMRQVDVEVASGSGLVVGAHVLWAAGLEVVSITDEDNLACKAVRELAGALGRTQDECIRIVIEKSIPHQTGLGGGSADAAAALVGAAQLWNVPRDADVLRRVAQNLGADVAFFLDGGCSLLEGRGDVFVRSLAPSKKSVVIVKPDGGVSTTQAYAAFDNAPQTIANSLRDALYAATDAEAVPLFNNLAPASETLHDQLSKVRQFLEAANGVEGVLLCGSGAGTFAVCDSYNTAARLATDAQKQGWWARSTSFTSAGAAVLPQ